MESSGVGVKQVYIRQTDLPTAPGVTVERIEVVGQNLKGATIHIYSGPGEYPLIVIDDITDGRLVASAEAYLEPGYYIPLCSVTLNLKGVLSCSTLSSPASCPPLHPLASTAS